VCVLEIKQGEGLRTNPGKKSTKNTDMAHFQYWPHKKKKKKKKKKSKSYATYKLYLSFGYGTCIDSIIGYMHQGVEDYIN
jgi:hypothetical protein